MEAFLLTFLPESPQPRLGNKYAGWSTDDLIAEIERLRDLQHAQAIANARACILHFDAKRAE
ncbi:MAG: hypothetical protein POG24_05410 [Acidocella sp.]|nr:hypothetical protein [Acidocella sp.]